MEEEDEVVVVDGGLHSTTATIQPFAAATQWAWGGNTMRVVEDAKSASSTSSVVHGKNIKTMFCIRHGGKQ